MCAIKTNVTLLYHPVWPSGYLSFLTGSAVDMRSKNKVQQGQLLKVKCVRP